MEICEFCLVLFFKEPALCKTHCTEGHIENTETNHGLESNNNN